MESKVERAEFLVKPYGYIWTVFVKMIETVEIALWGMILSVLLSIPLAYFAARNYTPNRFTYNAARSVISLLRSAPELSDSDMGWLFSHQSIIDPAVMGIKSGCRRSDHHDTKSPDPDQR